MVTQVRTIHNLALIGFMGVGKSSVGRLVASQLNFQFVDTDDLVEEMAGRRIRDIFETDGEPEFRRLEREVVRSLETRRSTVISTGGGVILDAGNLESLNRHAAVFCLWAGVNVIFERVRHQSHRPLLADPDPESRIRELLAEREPFYRKADVLINTEWRTVSEVAAQVLHQFQFAVRDQESP